MKCVNCCKEHHIKKSIKKLQKKPLSKSTYNPGGLSTFSETCSNKFVLSSIPTTMQNLKEFCWGVFEESALQMNKQTNGGEIKGLFGFHQGLIKSTKICRLLIFYLLFNISIFQLNSTTTWNRD